MKKKGFAGWIQYLPVLLLMVYLGVGLVIFRDYGASADEHIQIEGGHVMWDYINGKLFGATPRFPDLPPLARFQNRYYGQVASFPTVLIEAARGFSMDIATIVRLRHLWNFLTWALAMGAFAWLLGRRVKNPWVPSLGMVSMILLPKLFVDAFYNDRDILLMAWMIFSLAAFEWFRARPSVLRALLFALCLAVAVNTRIFALMLFALPVLYGLRSKSKYRKYVLIMLIAAPLLWLALYPMAWENPLKTLPEALNHFRTQQRSLDTNDAGELIFLGKYFFEKDLPWYYLPLWIFLSTPIMTQVFAWLGAYKWARGLPANLRREERVIDDCLAIIFVISLSAVIGLKLTLYTGWRHFYYLYIPIVWYTALGMDTVLSEGGRPLVRIAGGAQILSFAGTILWMIGAHPYEYVYFNTAVRPWAPGNFDRDYWVLSTTEMMEHLADSAESQSLTVVDNFAFLEYTIIGLPPQTRDRFRVMGYSVQRDPYEYVFYNYANRQGNSKTFPYYASIYSVERDGAKLGEIFRRSHVDEHNGADVIYEANASEKADISLLMDGDYDTFWNGADVHTPEEWVELKLDQPYHLSSIELFPGDYAVGFESVEIALSDDGETWQPMELSRKGSNGFAFAETSAQYVRLSNGASFDYPWSIRELIFYGQAVNGEA